MQAGEAPPFFCRAKIIRPTKDASKSFANGLLPSRFPAGRGCAAAGCGSGGGVNEISQQGLYVITAQSGVYGINAKRCMESLAIGECMESSRQRRLASLRGSEPRSIPEDAADYGDLNPAPRVRLSPPKAYPVAALGILQYAARRRRFAIFGLQSGKLFQ